MTHRLVGPVVFLVLMFLVFQAIYSWAIPLVGAFGFGEEWARIESDSGVCSSPNHCVGRRHGRLSHPPQPAVVGSDGREQ